MFNMPATFNNITCEQEREMNNEYYPTMPLEGQQQQIRGLERLVQEHSRPAWFVFSGLGAEYYGMEQQLMKLEPFRQSINKSAEYLRPYGINLIDLIQQKQNINEKSIYACAVAAIQLALVDCLRMTGVRGEGFIANTYLGELACAYADEYMTAKQVMLLAFQHGRQYEQTMQGQNVTMATVGLTWEQCQQRCPIGVVAEFPNKKYNTTTVVSGPKQLVIEFCEQLRAEGLFTQFNGQMNMNGQLNGQFYGQEIMPEIRMIIEQLERQTIKPSQKWIRTFQLKNWEETKIESIKFQQGLRQIPLNAVVIEIAPHTMVQKVLEQVLPIQCTIVPLMNKYAPFQLEHFWTILRTLNQTGLNAQINNLLVAGEERIRFQTGEEKVLPKMNELLGHVAKWGPITELQGQQYQDSILEGSKYQYTIDMKQAIAEAYLAGHQMNGQVVYPTAGFMYLVWNTFAKLNGMESVEQMPIQFEDFEIIRQTVLKMKREQFINFVVEIKPTGLFKIFDQGEIIVTGRVFVPKTKMFAPIQRQQIVEMLEKEQIYKQMQLNGYKCNGEFQPIIRANKAGQYGELLWAGKWISFIQAMIQMNTLKNVTEEYLPTGIRAIKIDPIFHLRQHRQFQQTGFFTFPCESYKNQVVCGGIEIEGINMKPTTFARKQLKQQIVGDFVQYVEKQSENEYVLVDKLSPLTSWEQQQEQQFILDQIKRQHQQKKQEQQFILETIKQQQKQQQLPELFEKFEKLNTIEKLNNQYEQVLPRSQSVQFMRRESPLNTFAPMRQQQVRPLYELVSRIIKNTQQWKLDQTLDEMNVETLLMAEVQEILEQYHNIHMTMKQIRQLTLEKLRMIEQQQRFETIQQQEPTSAYRMKMVNYLQKKKLMAVNTIEKLNEIELISQHQTPLFVIHPIEGHVSMLRSWAKHMKVPVYGLQYTQEAMKYETVEELAQFYWSKIQQELFNGEPTMFKRGQMMPRIHICGYTFGAPVARELALRFPEQVATLSFLGGEQQDLEKFTTEQQFYGNNMHQLLKKECEALYWYVQQHTQGTQQRQFVEELMKLSTLEQRIRYAVREMMTESKYQFDRTDVEQALYAFLKKVKLSAKYNPTQSLRTKQVLLIKPKQEETIQYGIKQFFDGKLQVETVEGDKKSFLEGQHGVQVARLLNEFFYRYL